MVITEQKSRDLLLRPTDLEPGMYTAHDEEGPYAFMVCAHTDGKTYEMFWCESGEGRQKVLPGDILFEGVYATGMSVDYPRDSGIEVTQVPVEAASGYKLL
jgi:hypothetical protein